MRRSKVLEKWRAGQFARFCGLGHVLPFYVKHAAHRGYDGIWLDLEHRAMGTREVQMMVALSHTFDIDCMVRPPTTERTRLYRYLEDGAAGFMIPFVSTPEIAEDIVRSTKFPPLGNRGLDGAGMDCGFALDVGDSFTEDANRETFIVAQIETSVAVENAEAIAAVDGIDLLFVGPGDLGLRLGLEQKMSVDEAVEEVARAAKAQGKAWGRTAGSVEELERLVGMGAQMLPWGGDWALTKVLETSEQELDAILGG